MIAVTDLAAFAVARRPLQDRGADALLGSVRWALHRYSKTPNWSRTIVNAAERQFRRTYRTEAGKLTSKQLRETLAQFRESLRINLERTEPPTPGNFDSKAEAIARWVSNAAINGGTMAAGDEVDSDPDRPNIIKTWVTMHDDRVRDAHRRMDGLSVRLDQTFSVDGHPMKYPGDPIAPPDLTVNCRCVLAIRAATLAASANEGVTMTDLVTRVTDDLDEFEFEDSDLTEAREADAVEVPWHGVLAPEDVQSGDGRKFGAEALRWRDLPLPLSWQKVTATGHDGAVVVGRIDEVWREGNLIKASGMFLTSDESAEAIGLIAEGGIRGVSVDVDDATMELQNSDGSPYDMEMAAADNLPVTVFPSGRICGATLCAIPAFSEAFVSLGDWEARGEITAAAPKHEDCQCSFKVDEGKWNGAASNYTDEQYYAATIIHLVTSGPDRLKKANNKLPILTPNGVLSRAGVHAAVSRLGSTDAPPEKISQAKAALRTAYRELKEEPPDTITASADEDREFDDLGDFVKTEDGPGWLTHPVDTERLRRYWTKGPGAAKIRWGTPGDFNRCRSQLAKYVKPQYLSGYCANRHYDATGFWPGDAPSEGGRGRKHSIEDHLTPSVNLVASAVDQTEYRFFENPGFDRPTPLTIDDDGRVYGHLAQWGTCHVGFKGICIDPPRSSSGYAHFLTGATRTERGDVPTGHITLGDGHAADGLSHAAARAHYDNTCTVVADITCGDDDWGIWFSGLARDWVMADAKTLREFRAAPLSGDWRGPEGRRELVAALGVNVPGFLVPRIGIKDGRQVSLVAAGALDRNDHHVVSSLDIGAAIMAAVDEIETRKARKDMAELAKSLGRDPRSRMAALRDSMKV